MSQKGYLTFSIGNYRFDQRNGVREGETKNSRSQSLPVVVIKNPGQVFGALIGEGSVASLPFIQDLARISSR